MTLPLKAESLPLSAPIALLAMPAVGPPVGDSTLFNALFAQAAVQAVDDDALLRVERVASRAFALPKATSLGSARRARVVWS